MTDATASAPPDALADPARLAAVEATGLFHPETEAAFDRLARVACRALDASFSLVSLLGAERQVAKGRAGSGFDEGAVLDGICQHTVAAGAPLAIPDTRADPRVCSLPPVRDGLRAYLGVPLAMPGGAVVGSFMVGDADEPRAWTDDDVATLEDLAAAVVAGVAARAALRAQGEARFRTLFDGVSQLTGLLAPDGAVVEANRTALAFAGLDREAIVGRPLWEALRVSDDVERRHRDAVGRAAAGEAVRYEETVRDRDGRERILDVSLGPAPGGSGLLLVEGRDVTEAVRLRNVQLAMMVGLAGTWELDLGTGAVVAHGSVDVLFGLDPEGGPYTADAFFSRIHADDVERVRAEVAGSAVPGGAHQTEYRVPQPDGTVRHVRSHGVTVGGPGGGPLRMVGALADVTRQREEAEAAARAAAELQIALNAAALGRWEVDLAGGPVHQDARARAVHGLGPGEGPVPYEAVVAAVHPDDRGRTAAAYAAAAEVGPGGRFDEEYRVLGVGGAVRWVRAAGQVRDNGAGGRLVGVAWDVTAEREAEAALRESEARYRTLFESVDVGFCIIEVLYDGGGAPIDFRYLETNPAFVSQAGLEGAVGRTIRELVPDLEHHWIDLYAAVAATGEPVRYESEAAAMGQWFSVYATRVGGPGSRRVAVLFTDVTEQKGAERALRESEARFRGTFENAAVGIAHVGLDGRWLDVNERLCEIVGYSHDEMLRRTFQDITHPDDLGVDLELFERLLAGETDHYQLEKRYVHRDGHAVWINLTVAPDRQPDGRTDYTISVVEDVSEKKAAEAALVALNDALEDRVEERTAELARSNEELDQFAYVASHDLKAPLRAIDSLATWIAEDAADRLPPESARHLGLLRQRAARMEGLLNGLLAYSRVGRKEAAPEPVETGALVRDVVATVAPPEGFDVRVEGPFPVVETARAPLALVLRNLVGNAIKHHDRADGRVTVSARARDGWAEFTVEDDGPGVPAEYRDRVFGLFQTLRPRDEVEGSGMGLAIVKKTVEGRGGRIALETAAGGGARFRFTWPLRPAFPVSP